ncbi:MAG: type II toxin-antitoxin system RelE/ParE family toxin [Acutalibacteraceae bacterium]
MKIYYRPAAIEDIKRVSDYIENTLKNPVAAQRLKSKILNSISLLKENPEMGVLLKNKYEEVDSDYRFITINKQLVFYQINDDIIEIVRIIDGRTDYMTHLFE